MIVFEIFKKEELVHGITEKAEGDVNPFSNPDASSVVLNALNKEEFDFKEENLVFAEQVHGRKAHLVPSGMGGYIKLGVDALVSKNPGQILLVKTADCIPLLIYDRKGEVAAVHAGRKGIVKGVIEEAADKMDSDNSNLLVGMGPHIRKCCYFLRGEIDYYQEEWGEYIEERGDKHFFDITKVAKDKLLRLGVKEENIEDTGICTHCSNRFFSARKRNNYKDISCFGSFIGLYPR